MATVACPYCYNKINQASLAYQCLGRGAPGGKTRCTKAVDSARSRMTNVSVPSYPCFTVETKGLLGSPRQAPCPTCGGVTGVRACPFCHTPLSSTFAESRSPLVGMVGGKGAGKTIYMAVLHHELRTAVRRRFQADIRMTGDQQGGAGSPREWLERNEEQLFSDGKLFNTTAGAVDGMRAPVVIEWRQPRSRLGMQTFDTTVLSFYDAAGEDLTNQDRVHTQAYLGVAEGLIVLLDPWQMPGALERIDVPPEKIRDAAPPLEVLGMITELLRTTHQVRAKKQVKVPLAVVFAKMDAFFPVLGGNHPLMTKPDPRPGYDETVGQGTHELVKAMLHEYGADDIDAHLALHYSEYRYFAVSALGAAPDYAADVVDPGGVQPFRVEEPLLWLLNRFGVIDRSRT
ncbi:MAG: zinc ribbon domain-containing protein [Pseudonocardia sp.]